MHGQQLRRRVREHDAFEREPHVLDALDLQKQPIGLSGEMQRLSDHDIVTLADA